VLSGEATHTNFIVFGETRPGLEPTIYRTRGERANQYTTDAVFVKKSTTTNTTCGALTDYPYGAPPGSPPGVSGVHFAQSLISCVVVFADHS
jgi:hypothetical protein